MKTKKTLSFMLLLLIATISFSCKKDDLPIPEITNVEITGGENADGSVKITVGESVTYSLKVDNVTINRYEWYVDNDLKSKDEKFIFTPDKRGVYAIHVKVYNNDDGVAEKNIGKLQAIDKAAIIESFTMNGDPFDGVIKIPMTPEELTFKANVTNVEVSGYKWLYNNKEIEDATTNTIKLLPKYSGILKVIITNLDGIVTEEEVELEGVFKEGVFFFGSTNESISFYDPQREFFYRGKDSNLYQQINNEEIGRGGINDVVIQNNKIYFLLPSSKEEQARVVIADAQTLAKIDVVTAVKFNTKNLGQIYNLAIVNEDKAYIGYNASSSGNISGVRVLDMKAKTLSEPIEGTSGKLGVDGPAWSRMLKNGNDILIACGTKLQVVDGETDKVKKTIKIADKRQIIDILKGEDEDIFLIVHGEKDSMWGSPTTSSSIVKIDNTDYSIVKEDILKYEDKDIHPRGGLSSSFASISHKFKCIYFIEDGWFAQKVYKYNYTTGKVEDAIDIKLHNGLNDKFSGYTGVDKDGNLYVPTTDYTTSKVGFFAPDGSLKEVYQVKGDANVISTHSFN